MYLSQKLTPVPQKRIQKQKTKISPDSDRDTKDHVNVYCRLRQLKNETMTKYMEQISSQEIKVKWNIKGTEKELYYKFKEVFNADSTQEEVYIKVAHPLVHDLIEGKNGLLFSYGVTASGKTYTLQGDRENPGILPRCVNVIFNSLEGYHTPKYLVKPDKMNGFEIQSETSAMQDRLSARATSQTPKSGKGNYYETIMLNNDGVKIPIQNNSHMYAVFISYIEIYNNTTYDLLEEPNGHKPHAKVLSRDLLGNMYVNGGVEVEVKNSEEAYALLTLGQNLRKRAQTLLNTESSRSHSIFNIRVVQLKRDIKNVVSDQGVIISQLSLVDLAGSERTNRTQNSGARLKESGAINNSLMTLRLCLHILMENQQFGTNKLVPYRDSKLTLLFKNYFEGNGRVHMIICVKPTVSDLNENLQVMKFAEFSQAVQVSKSEPKYTPVTIKSKERPTTKATSPQPSPALVLPSCQFCEEFGLDIDNHLRVLKTFNDNALNSFSKIEKEQQDFKKQLIKTNKLITPSRVKATSSKHNNHGDMLIQDKPLRMFLEGKVKKACAELNMGSGVDKAHDKNIISSQNCNSVLNNNQIEQPKDLNLLKKYNIK